MAATGGKLARLDAVDVVTDCVSAHKESNGFSYPNK